MESIRNISRILSKEQSLNLSISFGVFLFVLFFQPFQLRHFDSNNLLVFVAGLAAIVFLILVIIRTFIPMLLVKYGAVEEESNIPAFLSGFIILAVTSLSFIFYLRYVGNVSMSFYNVIKVILICLIPVVASRLYDVFSELKQQNKMLILEKQSVYEKMGKLEDDRLNRTIEFGSEYGSENVSLIIADIFLVKSADNYVEIVHKQDDVFHKKLIRNTMKSIELQLRPYSNFVRCHRTSLVNIQHFERLNRNHASQWLKLKGFDEQIPVSRQYLLKLKERLHAMKG